MVWVSVVLATGCLAVGSFHLARLAVLRTDVAGEAAHAAMGVGMAAMFSPLGDPVPDPIWTVVFGLSVVWFVAQALRARSVAGDVGHHIAGGAAMLFMLLSGESAIAGMDMTHMGGGTFGLGTVAAVVLAGYFGWHVLRCTDRLRLPPVVAEGAVAVRTTLLRAPRTATLSHVAMALGMSVMLLGMV
jgi:hypothetical protein